MTTHAERTAAALAAYEAAEGVCRVALRHAVVLHPRRPLHIVARAAHGPGRGW